MSRARRAARWRAFHACVLALAVGAAAGDCLAQPPATAAPGIRVKDLARSSPGKPQPPIAVDYRLSAVPAVGVPLVVTITARAAGLGAVTLDVQPGDGLTLLSPPVPVAARAAERAWEVRVVPLSPRAVRLNVLVTGQGAAGPEARSVVVPIGTDRVPSAAPVGLSGRGERVVTLPANESATHESP